MSWKVSFTIAAGERVALIGANGIGKTTLMRCLAGELAPRSGRMSWVENAQPGYMPQDPQAEFAEKVDLFTWMSTWTGKADDEQIVRATLGGCCSRAMRLANRSRCCRAARKAA